MYESIRGTLKEKNPTTAVVECNGIGYRLQIPLRTYLQLPESASDVFLFLSHIVREDAHSLYAFLKKEERNLFETLLSISGIGPKTAAGIIGHIEIEALKTAIASADVRLLSKVPGIGKKTAERLIVELRDKIKGKDPAPVSHLNTPAHDAACALMNLGYSFADAQKAVQKALAQEKDLSLGQLITAALRHT